MATIKELLYQTAHRNKKPVKQIADETGISDNYLYRATTPGESGVKFPIEYLIPLMKSTNDYSILSHLCNLCGYIMVKQPRFKALKGETTDIMSDYQGATVEALTAMKKFFEMPTRTNKDELDKALIKVMEETAASQKYSDKYYDGQPELF